MYLLLIYDLVDQRFDDDAFCHTDRYFDVVFPDEFLIAPVGFQWTPLRIFDYQFDLSAESSVRFGLVQVSGGEFGSL